MANAIPWPHDIHMAWHCPNLHRNNIFPVVLNAEGQYWPIGQIQFLSNLVLSSLGVECYACALKKLEYNDDLEIWYTYPNLSSKKYWLQALQTWQLIQSSVVTCMKASETGLSALSLVLADTNTTICHETQSPHNVHEWALVGCCWCLICDGRWPTKSFYWTIAS